MTALRYSTGLLVSVRNATEAAIALAAGADVIDVKEPSRGALGAADFSTIQSVVETVASQKPTSAAFGELAEQGSGEMPVGLTYAKIALAGLAGDPTWQDRWRRWASRLPPETAPVAVAYADAHLARSPPVTEVFALAVRFGAPFVLLDTFDKRAANLLDHLSLHALGEIASAARAAGLGIVLAGSLTAEVIPSILPLWPAYIAVRGAACRGNRDGPLVKKQIELLRQILDARSSSPEPQRPA
jgi:uncharacterized protein (UPF0264 family)